MTIHVIAITLAGALASAQVTGTPLASQPASEHATEESWDEPASAPAPAADAPAAESSLAPRLTEPPPPPPDDLDDPPRDADGRALVATGAALIALGAAGLFLVAMPAAIVKQSAMNRAEREVVVDLGTREDRYRRARVADDVMEAGFWGGVVALGVGIPLLVAGVVLRKRAREDLASRVELNATGVQIRF